LSIDSKTDSQSRRKSGKNKPSKKKKRKKANTQTSCQQEWPNWLREEDYVHGSPLELASQDEREVDKKGQRYENYWRGRKT